MLISLVFFALFFSRQELNEVAAELCEHVTLFGVPRAAQPSAIVACVPTAMKVNMSNLLYSSGAWSVRGWWSWLSMSSSLRNILFKSVFKYLIKNER